MPGRRSALLPALFCLLLLTAAAARGEESGVSYDVGVTTVASTGDFAPYLIGSLNHGKTVQKWSTLADMAISRPIDRQRRFSWGFGVEGIAGVSAANDYGLWDESAGEWTSRSERPPLAWLQQLYAEVKYRSLFLTVGLKEYDSALLDNALSSGDLVESGNSRPIPQARMGFIDFQDIPFTRGWVQIQGEVAYGLMPDNGYLKHHYNYYNYHISLNSLYVYKRCYFRTDPRRPLSVTVGMQAGSFFGGTTYKYSRGSLVDVTRYSSSPAAWLKMLLPIGETGELYYIGSTIGSWDLHARYRLPSRDTLTGYFHWLWEDGSGIGKLNGWDGLWGIEYRRATPGIVNCVVLEYLDFRNQSGSIHWDPDDAPQSSIPTRVTGEDNYYNNGFYNSYANYGMAIGSPAFLSPVYNLDGFPGFTCNRFNGFHLGVGGDALPSLSYRLLMSYTRGLGNYTAPFYHPRTSFSMAIQADYDAAILSRGLALGARVAFDTGTLRGRNFGVMLSVGYSGVF